MCCRLDGSTHVLASHATPWQFIQHPFSNIRSSFEEQPSQKTQRFQVTGLRTLYTLSIVLSTPSLARSHPWLAKTPQCRPAQPLLPSPTALAPLLVAQNFRILGFLGSPPIEGRRWGVAAFSFIVASIVVSEGEWKVEKSCPCMFGAIVAWGCCVQCLFWATSQGL